MSKAPYKYDDTSLSKSLPAMLTSSTYVYMPSQYEPAKKYVPIYEEDETVNLPEIVAEVKNYNTIYIPNPKKENKFREGLSKIYHWIILVLASYYITQISFAIAYSKEDQCNKIVHPSVWLIIDSVVNVSAVVFVIAYLHDLYVERWNKWNFYRKMLFVTTYAILISYSFLWTILGISMFRYKCDGSNMSPLYIFMIISIILNIGAFYVSFLIAP